MGVAHGLMLPARSRTQTTLDTRLNELAAKPKCSQRWPAFQSLLTNMASLQLSMDDQTKVRALSVGIDWYSRHFFLTNRLSIPHTQQALAEFCKSPCGPIFDAAAADWRGWCAANPDSFLPTEVSIGLIALGRC